jgi:hypothetical protein
LGDVPLRTHSLHGVALGLGFVQRRRRGDVRYAQHPAERVRTHLLGHAPTLRAGVRLVRLLRRVSPISGHKVRMTNYRALAYWLTRGAPYDRLLAIRAVLPSANAHADERQDVPRTNGRSDRHVRATCTA